MIILKNSIKIKWLLATLLFCSGNISLFAEKQLLRDTGFVNQRNFSDSAMSAYKQSRDFQYDIYVSSQPSLWDRFWSWFWNLIDEIMSTEGGRFTMNTLFIVFGITAIFFFIFKVMKMNKTNLFSGSEYGNTNYTIGAEDIYSISFDEAISKALEDGNFRLAVRLLYLQNLKLLADKNMIDWQLNKTNTAYINELASNPLQPSFLRLTHIFEYVWYGNSDVNKESFAPINNQFIQFKKQV